MSPNGFIFWSLCCYSLSFPPKLCAAMENSYAPSNVTLLILATRTGKCCWHIGAQAFSGRRPVAFRSFAANRQPVRSACLCHVVFCTVMLCFRIYSQSIGAITDEFLIWLQLGAPSIFIAHRFNVVIHKVGPRLQPFFFISC